MVELKVTQRFKVINEITGVVENHRIDDAGNHFIGKRCVNPKHQEYRLDDDNVWRDAEIGDTYPDESERLPAITKIN